MGETQIYSQRLHGINEKRRILSEVDRIQRELEQQRLKLQQLKRKSLRDRWLMDGLLPSPGAETDNPFGETEAEIRNLELQLENLQSELVYLENPELKVLKAVKVQVTALQNDLVNGDETRKQVDQNENHKECTIKEEDDQLAIGQGEDPVRSAVSSSTLSTKTSVDYTQPNPAADDHFDQKAVERENQPFSQENDLLNAEHSQEVQDQNEKHKKQDVSTQENDSDHAHADQVQSPSIEKLNSLESTLETEVQDLKDLTKELGHVSVNFDLQQSPVSADPNNSLAKQDENNKEESLLDEITKLVNLENQKESTLEEHGPASTNVQVNDQKDEEANHYVSVNHEQGNSPCREIVSLQDKEKLNLEEPAENPIIVSLKFDLTERSDQIPELTKEDQIPNSAPLPINQSSVLPPTEQDEHIMLPCKDQDPRPSLPSEGRNQVDQVQIQQVIVVSPPLDSQQIPSASCKPGSTEASTPPESQPLLQKPSETGGHQGANTAETRDKSTPVKKKTCQCCVVM